MEVTVSCSCRAEYFGYQSELLQRNLVTILNKIPLALALNFSRKSFGHVTLVVVRVEHVAELVDSEFVHYGLQTRQEHLMNSFGTAHGENEAPGHLF